MSQKKRWIKCGIFDLFISILMVLQNSVVPATKDVKSAEKSTVKESSDRDVTRQSSKDKQMVSRLLLLNHWIKWYLNDWFFFCFRVAAIAKGAVQERDAIRVKEKRVVDQWIETGLALDLIDVARFQKDVAHVPVTVPESVPAGTTEEVAAAPGLTTELEDVNLLEKPPCFSNFFGRSIQLWQTTQFVL